MTEAQLEKELWWDIRNAGFLPSDENVKHLLKKSYGLGYDTGIDDCKERLLND